MKKMSANQERKLLRALENCKPIGRGSSRIVYVHPFNKNLIVKVAVGANAFKQNVCERKVYDALGDEYCARIEAYGRFCIVMERLVRIYDYYDFEEEMPDEVSYVMDALTDFLGDTEDNYQIGKTADGRFVAYDYGFSTDADEQCGWAQEVYSKAYLIQARKILVQKRPINTVEKLDLETLQGYKN